MSEAELLKAWGQNAGSWTRLVRDRLIPSRVAVTDRAVLEAVGSAPGQRLLDLGCGEGWLGLRLADLGWRVVGVDAVPELVEKAREAGLDEVYCSDYHGLEQTLSGVRFDCIVANFSLLGERSAEQAVKACRGLLSPKGRLVIQTLHPLAVDDYREGWQTEHWAACPSVGCAPTPWYFRTLEGWCALLLGSGFALSDLREPRAGAEVPPSSLLLTASVNGTWSAGSDS